MKDFTQKESKTNVTNNRKEKREREHEAPVEKEVMG